MKRKRVIVKKRVDKVKQNGYLNLDFKIPKNP